DERIGDEDLAAALRNREAPGLDLRRDAVLDRVIVQRALLRVGLGHGAALVDGPRRDQLAGQVRPRGQLRLVAGADLRAVVVDDLADQLGVDRALHFRLLRPEADLAVLLAAPAALAAAEGLQETRLRDERLVVHLALGAGVAARSGVRAGLSLEAGMPRDRLARIVARLVLLLVRLGRRVVRLRRRGAHDQRARLDQ